MTDGGREEGKDRGREGEKERGELEWVWRRGQL